MTRVSLRFLSLLVAAFIAAVFVRPAVAANADPALSATYHGQGIDPRQVAQHYCHTRDYPVVRCFDSQAEVDADLGWIEPTAPGDAGQPARQLASQEQAPAFTGPFTIAFWDINYGGNSLTLYGGVANLDLLGWNDAISSIKSVNCGIPRYWVNPNYDGTYWQNGCNVWSPNVGTLNDQFSSVLNEAP